MLDRVTEIRYKCYCMPKEESLFVRARTRTEDIVRWMSEVAVRAIADDHKKRAPACKHTTMEYAKVAIHGDLIGGAPIQN